MNRKSTSLLPLVLLLATTAVADVPSSSPHGRGFAIDCSECHSSAAWTPLIQPLRFQHASTGFLLSGAHALADCGDCHETPELSRVGTSCVDCHRDPHAGELGFRCDACHDTAVWENQRKIFDAHDATLFPLLAVHARLECAACHDGQKPYEYASTPTDCAVCHRTEMAATRDPDHQLAGFGPPCEECHLPLALDWKATTFAHPETFRLAGSHAIATCSSCHAQGYSGTALDCYSCHAQDYLGARDPDHRSGFPTSCEDCHGADAWRPASFDHALTAFPLTGRHAALDCDGCHADSFAGTPSECFDCHAAEYRQADPDHRSAGFSHSCEVCHGTDSWSGAQFDHAQTTFPLTGGHAGLDCESCHADGYAATPSECFSCHAEDYRSADPDHRAAGFSHSCEHCHTTSGWEGADFDHNTTAFPLTGGHAGVDCASCHADGYTGTSTECVACHRADYRNAEPDHQAAGFPTTCEVCHGTSTWEGASFDHNTTAFPLRGSHRGLDCESCHADGYAGTPTDCYSCHRADYERADPNHVSAGFPTTCETCHRETDWDDTTFDHDSQYFPIYSGRHRNAWSDCGECHPAAGNFRVFECINCHEHRRSEMDSEHRGVSGYRYDSQACLNCHPNGVADD